MRGILGDLFMAVLICCVHLAGSFEVWRLLWGMVIVPLVDKI